jgi:hypothetical protein
MAGCGKIAVLALLGALLLAAPRVSAQRGLEYEVKAAYLYNIVNFVTWPADAFTGPNDPLHVCVYGADPFGRLLDNVMQGGTANKRPVQVVRATDAATLPQCEMIFLSGANTDRIDQAIRITLQRPALTVGESGDFLRRGGMIAFVIDGGRVRFDINLPVATSHGLTLSSRLLQVARTVFGSRATE